MKNLLTAIFICGQLQQISQPAACSDVRIVITGAVNGITVANGIIVVAAAPNNIVRGGS